MSTPRPTIKAPKALLKAQKLANLLDTAFTIPIVRIKVGLDFIVGLIPGVGDALMLFVALRIVWLGKRMGLPSALVKAMLRNAVIDFGVGFIPFIGDLFDLFYKANVKNVRIMEKWWVSQQKGNIDAGTAQKLMEWEAKMDELDSK